MKTDYILRAINNLSGSSSESSDDDVPNGHVATSETLEACKSTPGPSGDNHEPQISNQVREESLISEVKDLLPELGDGFVLKCLQYYDFKVDKVINSYLEDNLAESLKGKIIKHCLPPPLYSIMKKMYLTYLILTPDSSLEIRYVEGADSSPARSFLCVFQCT